VILLTLASSWRRKKKCLPSNAVTTKGKRKKEGRVFLSFHLSERKGESEELAISVFRAGCGKKGRSVRGKEFTSLLEETGKSCGRGGGERRETQEEKKNDLFHHSDEKKRPRFEVIGL